MDAYDFTGLSAASLPDDSNSTEWHYVRPNDQANHNWKFVYPYKYSTTLTDNPSPVDPSVPATPALPQPRLFGTLVKSGKYAPGTLDLSTLGSPDTQAANSYYRGKEFSVQVANTDFGGPKGAAATQFPYGGFARNGDLLQTTYIGGIPDRHPFAGRDGRADKERGWHADLYDGRAESGDDGLRVRGRSGMPNAAQNLGRFCPIHPDDCNGAYDDFDTSTPTPSTNGASSYHFATRLYDFLTVNAPSDDYMQNLATPTAMPGSTAYPVANFKPGLPNAYPNPGASPLTTEDTAPIDGLININTAPWRVLAALPMASTTADNQALAKAIVKYRDSDRGDGTPHGPFKSILELNGVPKFRSTLASTALGAFNPNGLDNGMVDGDLGAVYAGGK